MVKYLANIENPIFQMVQDILKNIILILVILVLKFGIQNLERLVLEFVGINGFLKLLV